MFGASADVNSCSAQKSEQLHQSTANNDLAHDVYTQSLRKAQTAVVHKRELIT